LAKGSKGHERKNEVSGESAGRIGRIKKKDEPEKKETQEKRSVQVGKKKTGEVEK